jgi:hypothetical protein
MTSCVCRRFRQRPPAELGLEASEREAMTERNDERTDEMIQTELAVALPPKLVRSQ